jgi:2-polyprenyl-3-methyl-5-hydroxy-6-metoxy-1,4-benzoquinol methylase
MTEAEHGATLDATGERLIPEAYAGEIVLAEHVARYRLAGRLAPGRRVLDAACGEGYGTAMLAAAGAAGVVGLDVDEPTVAHARQRYGLDMRVGDVAALPFGDGEFDLVVSFETIEHVPDPEAALSEFARVLALVGLLIVSTPNAREYLVDNPFHERELTPEELFATLGTRFAQVRPLYQQNFLTSAVLDAERLARDDRDAWEPLDAAKVTGVQPGRELYTLALCGNGALPELEANVAVLSDVYEAHQMASMVTGHEQRAEQAERNQRAWEERATTAERVQAEWEQRATTAEDNQRAWQERATEAERQNTELKETLERIAASLSWRITKPLRSLKGRSR